MHPGHENFDHPPSGHHRQSINEINLPSTHSDDAYERPIRSPILGLQPNNIIQAQPLPLYFSASTTNFSRVSPIGSSAGNVYRYCGPRSLSCNLDGGSYRHRSQEEPNRALHHGSFSNSLYNPELFGSRRPQISNNIQRNLFGQDLSSDGSSYSFGMNPCSEHGDVFSNQDTEGLQMHLANTEFPKTDNIESNGQHRPNSLENSSNTFSSSSAEEFRVTSMINTHAPYSLYRLPTHSAVTNQSSSSNSASHSSSLGEGRLAQSQFIAEQYNPCPSSYLSTDSTQEVDGIRLAVSSGDRCSTTNVAKNQVSSSNSAFLGEKRFEKSHINREQYLPNSSSLSDKTTQEILPSINCDTDLKDYIESLDALYRETVRELFQSSDGDTLNYVNPPYACNKLTETSNATKEVVNQLSSPVESMKRLPTELFCNFCYKNKEPMFIYKSHQLHNGRGIITCPVLRKYSCPLCGATGNFSHTLSYCPLAENNNEKSTPFQEMLRSRELPPSHSTPNSTPTSRNAIGQIPVVDQWSTALAEDEGFPYIPPSARRSKARKQNICKFCLKNKQPPAVFRSHKLRDEKGDIACPFLRKYVCGICGATGDKAHTRKYCPENDYEDFIRKFAN